MTRSALLFVIAAAAAAQTADGDLRRYFAALTLAGPRSEGFRAPSTAEIGEWKQGWRALLAGRTEEAARRVEPLGYRLIDFADRSSGRKLWIFEERDGARGLGTYVYSPRACRLLSIQAPHAGGDLNTLPQSVEVFLETDAVALLAPGTHRCANREASPCDGVTTVCTGVSERYPVSDVAHSTRNFFQPAHEAISDAIPNSIAVSVHGFTWTQGDPDAIIGTATCDARPDSIATQLARAYNALLAGRGAGALRAASCHDGGTASSWCGPANVQARYLAGTSDPCACARGGATCAAGNTCQKTMPYPERFLHIEQSCALRQMAGCERPEPQPWRLLADALKRLFPCWPRVAAVVHGASFEFGPLAPETFFTLFGAGLGPARVEACGREAAVGGRDGDVQVNALFPRGLTPGEACRVRAVLAPPVEVPLASNALEVEVAARALALFTYAGGLPVATDAEYRLIGPDWPARPGEAVVLWGTGGGPVELRVRVAGLEAGVEYDGPAPGIPGLWQINVRIPAEAPAGEVALELAGRAYRLHIGRR